MARQSIPRIDLYGELGVDPAADSVEIEAAYRELIDRQPDAGGPGGPGGARRAARLRQARDWLTDTERRNRYDASRARAAVRAAGKAAARPHDVIPWPAADLARAEAEAAEEATRAAAETAVAAEAADAAEAAEAARAAAATSIAWSATPPDPMPANAAYRDAARAGAPPRRRSRRPAVALGRVILVLAVALAAYLVATNLGSFNVAVNPTATTQPLTAPPPSPTVPATIPPTTAPTAPGPTDIPVAVLQQGAWDAVQAVQAAAAAKDLATIQSLVGDTAPDLRLSGVGQVEFPPVAVGDFGTQHEGGLYIALAAPYRLTSTDGQTWIFDWADRPLAAFRSSGKDIHDLWWTEKDGQHHLYLRITVATLSKQSVRAELTWTFDPARPDDATYFERAAIDVTGVSFDDQPAVLTAGLPVAIVGRTFVITSVMLTTPYSGALPSQLVLEITVTNPRTVGGPAREVPTTYTLPIR